ncbi:MAG TPA: hypothetical protein PKC21_00360 [Oligoflexia bacterium]|nr:hypothetical protein [Oligoflexia bacterium]HMR23779.1 hypothetical protein [Oligoflexia bacterium]
MTSYFVSLTLLLIFIFSFIQLVKRTKDQLFIKQAGFFALRSHYMDENYINTLNDYSKKTCQKTYSFQSSTLTENQSITKLKIIAIDQEASSYTNFFISDLKNTAIEKNLFYLGEKK